MAGTVSGGGLGGSDTLVSIEQIRGSAFNDGYVATGYTGVSSIGSTAADFNEFEGMAGDDSVTGNSGTQLTYLNATAGVTVNFASWVAGQGASGTVTGDASVGTDSFTGVQGVRGSEFVDTLMGSNNLTGIEIFQGRGGNDIIDGGGGFDRVLYGFRTDDNVTGGDGRSIWRQATVFGDASVVTIRCGRSKRCAPPISPIPMMQRVTTSNIMGISAAQGPSLSVASRQRSTNSRDWMATTPSPATATRGLITSTPPTA